MTKSTQLPPNGISWNLVFEKQTNSDHDLTALLTKVRLDESISMFVNKAFTDDWFNKTYVLKRQKDQLAKLLEIATTKKLFQFDGLLYEQTDGVAMGFPLGSLSANMCHLEHVPPRREDHTRCLLASSVQTISWSYSCKNADY